ncbi:MAG: AAA family ATPase [Muribaculaceae bacterium]|nr:AAA family ATPase [Muribaculaceae bacterium]
MSRYYVISPNVEGNGDFREYLEQMFHEHTIMMGWSPEAPKGRVFDRMEIGDYVICARGANSGKEVFFAGRVSSGNTKVWPFTRKLTGFVDLRNDTVRFTEANAYGASSQPPAIYELKRENEADNNICEYIKSKVDKMKSRENLQTMINVLKRKKNIILQGAPGTGKTYTTAEIALNICGIDTSSLSREQMMKKYAELNSKGQIAFSTFHQTMDYDDFIEGMRPQLENGQVTYDVEDGIFKRICQDARIKDESNFDECYDKLIAAIQNTDYYPLTSSGGAKFHVTVNSKLNLTLMTGENKNMNGVLTKESIRLEYFGHGPKAWVGYYKGVVNKLYSDFGLKKPSHSENKNYVLIIDEINRGNVSKIFGELITLLEADKREGKTDCVSARLSYSNMDFTVPDNLYIIGTMNTTDRSVGSIDYAIRRRFAFCTLESEWEIAENSYQDKAEKEEAKALYCAVENYIRQSAVDMDYEDLMVGHSYFMYKPDEPLEQRWKFEILPLLNEYYKDGICSKSPLEGIRKKTDGKNEKKLYMQKFIEKYAPSL